MLKPTYVNESNYRYYSDDDIGKLSQIIIFKELGLKLKEIKTIMTALNFDEEKVISAQKRMLELKKNRIVHLINELELKKSYKNLNFEEQEWEMVWEEIYSKQGEVQKGILKPVVDYVDLLKKNDVRHVLDLGCGTGRNAIYLLKNGFDVTATDISETGLQVTEKKARKLGYDIKTNRHDMRKMPFKDNTFDAILCSWVCGHGTHKDMVEHSLEMIRVVKSGGLIFVDYPSKMDKMYGVGDEIEKDTFLNNMPGEEKIPHHYSDEIEIRDIYRNHIKNLEPYTYCYSVKDVEYEIEAYIVILRKNKGNK